MAINGISTNQAGSAYNVYSASLGAAVDVDTTAEAAAETQETSSDAAVYEVSSHKGANALDAETIKAMKEELEQRTTSLVQQMLGKQMDAITTSDASFWQKFRTGEFKATPEQAAQAQKDIADDGYWGVEQTSDRIVKYATALSGGDPEKLDTLISAFEKGYAEAEKTWGGTLPDLCQRTREAVHDKFDALKKQYANGAA